MMRFDVANRAGSRPHDQGVGGCHSLRQTHAAQHGSIRNAGRRKHDIPLGQFGQGIFTVQILNAKAARTTALIIIAEQEATLELAPDAAQRCRRQRGGPGPPERLASMPS